MRAANPAAESGLQVLDPDGDGPLPSATTYCDFDTEDGHWTLCLRANQEALTKSRYATTWGAETGIYSTTDSGGVDCTSIQSGAGTDLLFKDPDTGKYLPALGVNFMVSTGGGTDCFTATTIQNSSGFPLLDLASFELKETAESSSQHATTFMGIADCTCTGQHSLMVGAQYSDGTFKSWRAHVCGGGGPDVDDVASGHIDVYVR